jgi:hypothetical protein
MLFLFASLYNLKAFKLHISSVLIYSLDLFPYSALHILQVTTVKSYPAVLRTSNSQTCNDVVVLPLFKKNWTVFLHKMF